MGNAEKNCKWHFSLFSGGREEGPNDAMGQNFSVKPYASLVRESIQNSLDVPIDDTQPVIVSFSCGKIDSRNYSNFFELIEHIKGCSDYFSKNRKAVAKYDAMLSFFNNMAACASMSYIKISDSNTKGMPYKKDDTGCPFYAFVRAAGISVKDDGATGGTYGFGKAAYYQLSPINTILVSTRTQDDACYFEGASALCTHTYKEKKVVSVGFYDNNNGEPISNIDDIPARFQRNEPGTDFYILGFNESEYMTTAWKEMQEEVLRSFWLAIFREKLVVKIRMSQDKTITIDKSSLPSIMEHVFNDSNDNSVQNRALNPRPYYEAVSLTGTSPQYVCYEDTLPHLGKVMLYIKKDSDATDKIIYMRKPLMLVYGKRTGNSFGYYGVFVCSNKKGDLLLSELENPKHNQWNKTNYKDPVTLRPKEDGAIALEEVDEFCKACADKLYDTEKKTSLDIIGLEDYLYVPDSLIEDEEPIIDEKPEQPLGVPTGDYVLDSGSMTTNAEEIQGERNTPDESSNTGTVVVDTVGGMTISNDGKELVTSGHKDKKPKSKGGTPASGKEIHQADIEEENGVHYTYMNVPVRIFAQYINDLVYHFVIIHSDRVVNNGMIELVVCGEQSDDFVNIYSSTNGKPKDNTITEMKLEIGANRIIVRFSDNMPHTVKAKLYEDK